jgi:hypothetical protein
MRGKNAHRLLGSWSIGTIGGLSAMRKFRVCQTTEKVRGPAKLLRRSVSLELRSRAVILPLRIRMTERWEAELRSGR